MSTKPSQPTNPDTKKPDKNADATALLSPEELRAISGGSGASAGGSGASPNYTTTTTTKPPTG